MLKKTQFAQQICTRIHTRSGVLKRHQEIFHCSLGFKDASLDSQALDSTDCNSLNFLCRQNYVSTDFHNPRIYKTVAVYDRRKINLVFTMLTFFCEMCGPSLSDI